MCYPVGEISLGLPETEMLLVVGIENTIGVLLQLPLEGRQVAGLRYTLRLLVSLAGRYDYRVHYGRQWE